MDKYCSLLYREGAFKALVNMKNWLEYHSISMSSQRIMVKDMPELISVFIEHLDEFLSTAEQFPVNVNKSQSGRHRIHIPTDPAASLSCRLMFAKLR